jgi:hypothetical protein
MWMAIGRQHIDNRKEKLKDYEKKEGQAKEEHSRND